MKGVYPDAIVQDGVISCTQTGVQLPAYEGLVLAKTAGGWSVMFTELHHDGRKWWYVHYGAELNSKEIELFSKGNSE